MKKLVLALCFISVIGYTYGQSGKPYNQWSLDFAIGAHNVNEPLSDGLLTSSPGFGFTSIGVRYMFNNKFGLRANLGYHEFTEAPDTAPFKANYYRTSLEAVINAGNLLRFGNWTERFNLSAYVGGGSSSQTTIEPNDVPANSFTNVVFGVTPQYKLSDKVSLFADVSSVFHQGQAFTFDGVANPDDGFTRSLLNIGFGINVSLGSKNEHADFSRNTAPKKKKKEEVDKEKETTISDDDVRKELREIKEAEKKERALRKEAKRKAREERKLAQQEEKDVKESLKAVSESTTEEKKETQDDASEANIEENKEELTVKEKKAAKKAEEEAKKEAERIAKEEERNERRRRRGNRDNDAGPVNEIENLKARLAKAEREIEALKMEDSNPNKELIMTELDERYIKREEVNSGKYTSTITGGNVGFIRELLNRGYVNVYFDTNKTEIQAGSINAINYLKEFLNDNPYFRATLIGYADETGSFQANERLSYRRAKAVFDILVDAGVSPSRLTYAGAGVDATVKDKAMQLARRVTFKIVQ